MAGGFAARTPHHVWQVMLMDAPDCFVLEFLRRLKMTVPDADMPELSASNEALDQLKPYFIDWGMRRSPEVLTNFVALLQRKLVEFHVAKGRWCQRYPDANGAAADLAMSYFSDVNAIDGLEGQAHWFITGGHEYVLMQVWKSSDAVGVHPALCLMSDVGAPEAAKLQLNRNRQLAAAEVKAMLPALGFMMITDPASVVVEFETDWMDTLIHTIRAAVEGRS